MYTGKSISAVKPGERGCCFFGNYGKEAPAEEMLRYAADRFIKPR
jgi:hypothetical protein